jgi:predicted protein tyrosine phosphatase
MHQIDDNLFLGGLSASSNLSLLNQHGITSLVSALSSGSHFGRHSGITYHTIDIDDMPSANIKQYIPEALKFIDKELRSGKKVLIHCAAGISRSSSIAVAYFMAKYNLDFDSSLAKVRQGRACATPNMGFEQQLRSLNPSSLRSYLSS